MKIIHLSDLHLRTRDDQSRLPHPAETLDRVIDDIRTHHDDGAICMVTGDLTHHGTAEQYAEATRSLGRLNMPVHCVPGNHDLREGFPEIIGETQTPDTSVITPADQVARHQAIMIGKTRLVMLDTLVETEAHGYLAPEGLSWLENLLKDDPETPVLLFMHHPPHAMGLPFFETICLQDIDEFARIVRDHRQIRHIFCGHLHRPVTAIWQGTPLTIGPSSWRGEPLVLVAGEGLPDKPFLEPGYGIALVDDYGSVTYHYETVRV